MRTQAQKQRWKEYGFPDSGNKGKNPERKDTIFFMKKNTQNHRILHPCARIGESVTENQVLICCIRIASKYIF